jgi:hypothetical protein
MRPPRVDGTCQLKMWMTQPAHHEKSFPPEHCSDDLACGQQLLIRKPNVLDVQGPRPHALAPSPDHEGGRGASPVRANMPIQARQRAQRRCVDPAISIGPGVEANMLNVLSSESLCTFQEGAALGPHPNILAAAGRLPGTSTALGVHRPRSAFSHSQGVPGHGGAPTGWNWIRGSDDRPRHSIRRPIKRRSMLSGGVTVEETTGRPWLWLAERIGCSLTRAHPSADALCGHPDEPMPPRHPSMVLRFGRGGPGTRVRARRSDRSSGQYVSRRDPGLPGRHPRLWLLLAVLSMTFPAAN